VRNYIKNMYMEKNCVFRLLDMPFGLPAHAISDQAKYECYNAEYERVDSVIRWMITGRDDRKDNTELDASIEKLVAEVLELLHERNKYTPPREPTKAPEAQEPEVPQPAKKRKPPNLKSRLQMAMQKENGVFTMQHYNRRNKVKSVCEFLNKKAKSIQKK
jgi:hypothetical protein